MVKNIIIRQKGREPITITERIDTMKPVCFRLEQDTLEKLDEKNRQAGLSRSTVLRYLASLYANDHIEIEIVRDNSVRPQL